MTGTPVRLEYSSPLGPFEFQLPDSDKVWSLPHIHSLPIRWREELAQTTKPMMAAHKAGKTPPRKQLAAWGNLQLKILDACAPGLTEALPMHGLAALIQAWSEYSKISLGESEASA